MLKNDANTSLHQRDRIIRVFVSSTFRDMQADRDVLVKKIFPQLRKLCEERAVTWTEVDLRWGITSEEAAEGKVLPLCLAEIQRCRPYFIGLLGERYGWVPDADAISPQLLEDQPWLREQWDGQSVTELEILHGVLNDPAMTDHAFFYFRDPAHTPANDVFVEALDANESKLLGPHEAEARAAVRREKLKNLKQRIRDASDDGKLKYPPRENYADPEVLGELVLADFTVLIEQLFPKEAVPDADEREAEAQEAHARAKRSCYVELPGTLEKLDAHVADDGPPLVITGESGGGKTALLAHWAQRWRQKQAQDKNTLFFQHYFGSTPDSAQALFAVQRLLAALKKHFDIPDEIPSQPDKLREVLPLWLHQTAGRGRVTLVFDALNQIVGEERDMRLDWLPRHFPPNVHVLCSALPGPGLDALRARGWPELALRAPDETEREQMVAAFLGQYRKTLPEELKHKLVTAPQSANPLFLRTVLDELRQFGSHESLQLHLGNYLKAADLPALFQRVMIRWEKDFDGDADLVGESLSLIWASRNGLSETELLESLGAQGHPLPRQQWTPFFLAVESGLTNRNGLLTFGHQYLRDAVQETYVSSEEGQRRYHLRLADYFEAQPEMGPRKAAEWPWQLRAVEDWPRLSLSLTSPELFLVLYNDRTKWELTGYWLPLREHGLDMEDLYRRAWPQWQISSQNDSAASLVANLLAMFLQENGLFELAEVLYRFSLEVRERVVGREHPDTLQSVNNLAALILSKGDYAAAEVLFRTALDVSDRVLGKEHPYTLISVNSLAALLHHKGDYAAAEPLYRRALETSDRLLGMNHTDTLSVVNNLAELLRSEGNYPAAEPLCRRTLEARERVLGREHPDTLTSMNSLGLLLYNQNDYVAAEPLLRNALEASGRVLGKEHPTTLGTLSNLASLLESKGDRVAAEPLCRRALEARERVLGVEHPDTLTSLNNLALLLDNKGDYATAEPLYRRALEARERVLGKDHADTLTSVNNLAGLLHAKGDYAAAEPLVRRVVAGFCRVSKQVGRAHPHLQDSANNYFALLLMTGLDREQATARVQELVASALR